MLPSTLKATGERFHFIATFLLAIALVPAMLLAGLPLKFNWIALLQVYWVAFAFQSIFAATLLFVIGFPAEDTFKPLWLRYKQDKRRLLLLGPFLLFLFLLYSRFASLAVFPFVVVVALAVLEFCDRTPSRTGSPSGALSTLLVPAAVYLFFGLVLVSAYNDIAVASRPNVSYDALFNRADSWILMGATVPGLVHHALTFLPLGVFKFLEFVYYYCMFPQVGAALILLAFHCGRTHTLRFAGTLLTAYYLSLALFWLWPSQGPFFLCGPHFAEFPASLATYSIQKRLLAQASSLWAGAGLSAIGLDYYIAFPSMHIAAPLIVAWYLRRWRRIVCFLLAVDLLVVVSIVFLEWHYVVDLLGGIVVAGVAVLMAGGAPAARTALTMADSGPGTPSPNQTGRIRRVSTKGNAFLPRCVAGLRRSLLAMLRPVE